MSAEADMHIYDTHTYVWHPQSDAHVTNHIHFVSHYYFFIRAPRSLCTWAHKSRTVITACSHKVKPVTQTAIPEDTTSPQDMRKARTTNKPTSRTSAGNHGRRNSPWAGAPWRCTLSSSRGSKPIAKKIDQINETKLFLQLRDVTMILTMMA